ncbi:hypothetical protein J6590_021583 [Homalodisca vitripennis]|nr:hypothetical protein J6590_021583 [Homalodisca vitripennis]
MFYTSCTSSGIEEVIQTLAVTQLDRSGDVIDKCRTLRLVYCEYSGSLEPRWQSPAGPFWMNFVTMLATHISPEACQNWENKRQQIVGGCLSSGRTPSQCSQVVSHQRHAKAGRNNTNKSLEVVSVLDELRHNAHTGRINANKSLEVVSVLDELRHNAHRSYLTRGMPKLGEITPTNRWRLSQFWTNSVTMLTGRISPEACQSWEK